MSMTKMLKTAGVACFIACLVAALCVTVPVARAQQKSPGVSGITDGEGNPVNPDAWVTGHKTVGSTQFVQRGQAWWPYQTPPPPFTQVGRSAENMTADEIDVNGVATLDIKNLAAAMQLIPSDLVLAPGSQLEQDAGYYLLKIDGFVRKQPQVDALEAAGASLGEYININTYIARIPSSAMEAVKALPFVTFVGDYHPAFKINPRIGLEEIPTEVVYDPDTGAVLPWLFEVTLHQGANLQEVMDALGVLGIFPAPEDVAVSGDMATVFFYSAPEVVPDVSKIPGVKWIAEKTYPRLLASATNPAAMPMLLQNNGVYTTSGATGWKLWNAGIDGSATGQIVTMMDTGLNTNMEHFSQNAASAGTVGASHRKVVGYDNYGGDVCVNAYTSTDGGHGTWTSQHAVGSISNMSGTLDTTHVPNVNYDDGVARGGKVYFQDIGTAAGTLSTPANLGASVTAAIGKGSYVQNYSWGTSSPTYDTQTSSLDTAMFANPGFVVTISAGNSGVGGRGTIGSPSTSKNAITVGGADAARPDYLFEDCGWDGTAACSAANDNGSSRGPVTTSLRVKPDIITYMWSSSASTTGGEVEAGDRPHAMCQTDATKTVYWDYTNNSGSGGTSFAAPEVAGLALLVRDYFQQGFYPFGVANPGAAFAPAGSLVKAMILASGENMTTTATPTSSIAVQQRYSNDVGFGRANLPSVMHIGSGAPFLFVKSDDALGDGATKSFSLNINSNAIPLRVLMVYYDAAGNTIQKDADLRVTIGSSVYWGNNFSSGWSTTATVVRDHTNPTEGVFLDAAHGLPASGTVQVDVIGYNDPGGMNYSLVVAGDVVSAAVTQVFMDKSSYSCNDTIALTVNDSAATSPVSVTLVSKDSGGGTIDTRIVSLPGAGGVFHGTIATGTGILVSNGGSLVATYDAVTPATASVACAVALDRSDYNCGDTIHVTVNDGAASSPIAVTLVSKDSGGGTVDTQTVSCTGSGGVFTGTIHTGSGIAVVDGGSLVASYGVFTPATSAVICQLAVADGGFMIKGGCDNAAAGTSDFSGPLFNGGSNEFYTKYMDAGEYSSYTAEFVNNTGRALTDVDVALSFSGAGAAHMTVLNPTVHVGSIAIGGTAGAVFQLYTDPTTPGLTSVNLNFAITAPGDGYPAATLMTQVQLLQTNDVVARLTHCSTFDTSPLTAGTWYESVVTGATTNPWRWIGSAASPSTVGSENRTDGICSSSAANKGMMVGNSATTTGNNFNNNADSFLLTNFQPSLRGNGPSGQPYHYAWKWHSFYHASEAFTNTSGVWGAFYNDQWNSATNPTADDANNNFPIVVCCYYHTILDYVGVWNWETANTGVPDNPSLGPTSGGAPNQLIITFNNVNGFATSGSYFAYGHEHADVFFFGVGTHGTHRDSAIDNDNLVYDEYYAAAQVGNSCGAGGQAGQVAFDRLNYNDCPSSTAVLSVVDADAVGPLQVTVTSPGTGDSEVVTLTGSAPYFSGNLTLSTTSGLGSNNGVLFVLPVETISASYTDASPAGTTSATANIGCASGDVIFQSNTQVSDNGDNDGIADNNETVVMDITIKNNMATPLTNAKVTIFNNSPNVVDCISDNQALYGTVANGATATNPSSDRFTFHVSPSVICSDWQNPPVAKFTVVITGDGFYGSSSLQTFTLSVNLDPTSTGGSYSVTQNFNTDPGWTTGSLPDDDGVCTTPYINEFHWCAACGNGGGGYGAWVGNSPFGTAGQTYSLADSSALYSPVFIANGNVTLQFSVAYRTELTYDGALVQRKVGTGAWTNVPFTTPAQAALTTSTNFCGPLASGVSAWTGTSLVSPYWTTTNAASVTATSGQTIQFRWRLGADTSVLPSGFGGFGVDNVVLNNLKQTLICEPTLNSCLPDCTGGVITCPAAIVSECQANLASDITVPPATAIDSCQAVGTFTNSYNAGGANASGSYPVGVTDVSFTVADAAGHQASCDTAITVRDTTPPAITCPQSVTVECQGGLQSEVTLPDATATDVCQPSGLVITNSYTPNGASASGSYPVGTTVVTFTAMDAAGNQSSCQTSVTVADTTPPVINCPQSVTVECQGGLQSEVTLPDATATDVCQPSGLVCQSQKEKRVIE